MDKDKFVRSLWDKDYFSSPDSRYVATKEDFLVAKLKYDPEMITSSHHYSCIANNSLDQSLSMVRYLRKKKELLTQLSQER